YTGLRFSVMDEDSNFIDSPTVNDGRFELRQVGQEWRLFVKAGQKFNANETITLNITAIDTTGHRDIETVSLTVAPAPPPLVIASPGFTSQP
ncbi:hypothetical protein, partial [Candidatus Puniceispirillum sp.]|uniref:hypothetical protein n=1 Tax=Candidatus Puniceispirillum sp. TaxID=2026719 RepID=UPI003F6A3C6B